ncbi:uncharacterized protein LOC100376936 [Saccoglossus kowalevskii]|uniref:F-box only protein 42-like n=1 Tax=Saccoglossus kowalevskii TaxID=10224 RepID=A0ABM0GV65_SACKO|nr:PREDICTED: F-box only protein 42-like [Saccoglossus kowalevskii]
MATLARPVYDLQINLLPEEIVERILSYLSPYDQLKQGSLVCKLWHRLIQGVIRQKYYSFQHAVQSGSLQWSSSEPNDTPLTARYSHSACYLDRAMYVFGGCSSASTAFNDMWKMDLGTGEWSRVLATGMYPSPKACASMVSYKDTLLLFGGWAPPVPYPLHQAPRLFNELHMYIPSENKWCAIVTTPTPPPVASHAASVVEDKMIIFGGLCGHQRSNDVWILDIQVMLWELVQIDGIRPRPRFGHSQVVVNDRCLLILGGCGGANMMFNDAWVLRMDTVPWMWQEVDILNEDFAAPQLWCHPACKIGERVVVFSKSMKNRSSIPTIPLKPQHQRSHTGNNFVLRANAYRHHSSPPRANAANHDFRRQHSPQRVNMPSDGRESPVHTRHGSLRRRPVVRTFSDPENNLLDWEMPSRTVANSESRDFSPQRTLSRRCSLGSTPVEGASASGSSNSFSRCVSSSSSSSFGSPARTRIFKLRHLRSRSDAMDNTARSFSDSVLRPPRGRYEDRDSNNGSPTRSLTVADAAAAAAATLNSLGACSFRNELPDNDRFDSRSNSGRSSPSLQLNGAVGGIPENGHTSPSHRSGSPGHRQSTQTFGSPCRKNFRTNSGTKFNAWPRNTMQMYVLDISNVANNRYIAWQPVRTPLSSPSDSSNCQVVRSNRSSQPGSPLHQQIPGSSAGPVRLSNNQPITTAVTNQHGPPPETSLYSLVVGRGELVMFGGMLDDVTKITPDSKATATNAVYFAF